MGVLETIKLAGTLVFAIPAAFAGLQFLLGGETALGATLLGLAVALVLVQRYVTPSLDPKEWLLGRATDAVAPDEEETVEERSIDE